MHAMIDQHDRPVLFQAIVGGAGEPLMHLFAHDIGACIGHRAERIIDQEHVCAAPHDGATNTSGEVAAAILRSPTAACLRILGQPRLEHVGIFL